MTEPPESSFPHLEPPCRVTSPEVADVLRQVQNVQRLRHFMREGGSTVSAFAAALDWPTLRAYRQVKTFERLGLLREERQERRAGRAVRWYVCPHRRYFLPVPLVSVEDYLESSFQPHEGFIKAQAAQAAQSGPNPVKGLLVGAFGEGAALVPADRCGEPWTPDFPGAPALHYGIGPLFLDYAQAKALQQELTELFGRYSQLGGAARYLYHVMLTPDASG
ncbi:hypothetical protein SAMN04488058_102229 [Deinococcus reticulitermitis]|uniref:Uncharacterized protein n=1 Tax=Deinococcus reticulitermitis TaxID=856736 RepID=A0A1H6UJ56_9DEIO|nr:helix-turn-helix transcriptional regulator [Deinococcus reticulitermitis]SEI92328.1 hypothetical protein SAMN04488058_102229 [Deinococcus reticulitermitis]